MGLDGTRWVVRALVDGDAVTSVPAGVVASIAFDGGHAVVRPGCNNGRASATVGDRTIHFGPMALTMMMCPPPQMDVERHVTATLVGEVDYRVEAEVLHLTRGGRGLVLLADLGEQPPR